MLFKFFLVLTVAAVVLATATPAAADGIGAAACHNATGACTSKGFVCANLEIVDAAKRCDGVEDCADGTDEYLCHLPAAHGALSELERAAEMEVQCVKCYCKVGVVSVSASNAYWFKIATSAPQGYGMMSVTGTYQSGAGCSPKYTSSMTVSVYKKQNKGCRGRVCCLRQQSCDTCTGPYKPYMQCNSM